MRRLLIAAGIVWVAALHGVAVLAFFAPHVLPYQGWRLSLPPTEPTAYVAERHRMLVHRDANAEPGGVVLLGASHLEGFDPALLAHPVRNYAAGGDTLRNATARVADYPNLATADAIVVQAAYNDLAHRNAAEVGTDMSCNSGAFTRASAGYRRGHAADIGGRTHGAGRTGQRCLSPRL